MIFKCGKFIRKGKQMNTGFKCHAKIKISKDMLRYKVQVNSRNDQVVWHKHNCLYKKRLRINTVVAHLDEKTLTLNDNMKVQKDEESVR
jgi:hypothetical protein